MLAEQRYKMILHLMQHDGSIKASELKDTLEVSSETVRRDLENMEAQGLLRRTHGGAMLPEADVRNQVHYTPFAQREQENAESKAQVARLAASYIAEGQSVALDSGTTALELARVIKHRFANLMVVTNSLAIANELADAPGITLILTGGVYKPEEAAFTSDMATLLFSKLRIDTFFLTTCGISAEWGVTYQRMDEIIVQEKMMDASEKTICITDSSKLGVDSLVKMCDISRIHMLITDTKAAQTQIAPFEKAGVIVVTPERNAG